MTARTVSFTAGFISAVLLAPSAKEVFPQSPGSPKEGRHQPSAAGLQFPEAGG